jgi:phenylalanyl-tRNA synthetase alpha chain
LRRRRRRRSPLARRRSSLAHTPLNPQPKQQEIAHSRVALTDEGRACVTAGRTPEYEVFSALPEDDAAPGVPLAELKQKVSREAGEGGFKQAMANRWIALEKPAGGGEPLVKRKPGLQNQKDAALAMLVAVDAGDGATAETSDASLFALLKRRRLVKAEAWKTYRLTKGPHFALERKQAVTELTAEMVSKGTWRDVQFKAYNFAALGRLAPGGALHPLLKVRSQFRKIFTQMGFEEMPTANYVESAFWNFDALFQPQQHPARDAHDTFFLTFPSTADLSRTAPADYISRVREVHERGGHGSAGYGYCWKESEAAKNLLRTHTTAVSSRMLFKLAQEMEERKKNGAGNDADAFRPAKYFSIDRVFRNEAVDRTHLAEFHQVEGLVCDRGLTLGDLIGTLREFFARLGMTRLRFKPAYNPYTEPSMEIFAYSEELKKWMEVGNSGMFRPEMLGPMGLPPEVRVIAWGLSLERPTMILYGVDNIRDLFGHKVSLSMVRKNPICRLGL